MVVTSMILIGGGCGGSGTDLAPINPTVRETQFGKVEGIVVGGDTLAWLGIPFAAPPVGNLRWQPPQDPDRWDGIRQVKQVSDACAQVGNMYGPPAYGSDFSTLADTFWTPVGTEDCLYMNIWRPKTTARDLPVLVFIHGGSNRAGYAADPSYDGSNLANSGNLIVVTVPYRLNFFGWFTHPALRAGTDPVADSGNFALLDLIMALKFIKNNIANFGGNPENVTIMGHSAGSQNVHGLILSPHAAGLFHKAIPLSAPGGTSPVAAGESKANAMINAFLIKDGYAADNASADAFRESQSNAWIKSYLMGKSAEDIVNIQSSPTGGKFGTGGYALEPGSATTSLGSIVANIGDGTVLPHPGDVVGAVLSGNFNRVPLLIGNTSEEGKLFTQPAFGVDDAQRFSIMYNFDPDAASGISLSDLLDPEVIVPMTADAYNQYSYDNAAGLTPGPVFSTVLFVGAINQTTGLYKLAQPQIYAYSFNWDQQPEPWNTIYGASHAMDLPFIFGKFGTQLFSCGFSQANESGRLALSEAMQKSIAAFARTGDPNHSALGTTWQLWSQAPGEPKKLIFDADATSKNISMWSY